MTDTLKEKINEWLKWDKNEKTRNEIQCLQNAGDAQKLQKLVLSRLEFGTAGLRGKMGAGFSQMNDLVIIQTAQGLLKYLCEQGDALKEYDGIVVGYDGRYNSKRFAEITAAVFLNNNFKVYLFSRPCPTPFIPFSVCHLKCICGVMVTASHNPKEDNGYKVYWSNGAQILSPHDKNIQKTILKYLEPWENSWDTSIVKYSSSKLIDPLDSIEELYYSNITKNALLFELKEKSNIKFTYSAMHGVGHPFMKKAFEVAHLKSFVSVQEQQDIDPEFSTVKFPNPEEGKSALNLSFQTANSSKSTVILANDPDADRLAVAEKMKNGNWHVFTGNELGALLGWWAIYCHKQRNMNTSMEDVVMLSSAVSSKILQSMAKIEGFTFVETLTGFKWMGNKAWQLLNTGKTVLFAFEEAIGFMCGTAVLDKDGISAGIEVAQLAIYLESIKKTLKQQLEEIYLKYGQHLSLNSYYLCFDSKIVDCIFEKLSNFKGEPKTYPESILDGKYNIVAIRDLRYGYDSSEPDLKPKLPISSSSYMITFRFGNGLVATLRTSGTEPKIKYYTELCSRPEEQNIGDLKLILKEMVEGIIEAFLKPQDNNLIAPED